MEMPNFKEVYDQRYSEGYREQLSGYEVARWKAVGHFLKSTCVNCKKPRRILDYGAGSGLHVRLWENVFPEAELHFCDISSVALDKLKRNYPEHGGRCHLVRHSRADIEDGLFQLIVSVEVMEHVQELVPYLKDIYRLLEPRGCFVWTAPCANRMSIEHIYNALTGKIESTQEGYRRWTWEDPTHLRRLKSREIKGLLEQHGFSEVRFRFRAHFFSFLCTRLCIGPLVRIRDKAMLLDYLLFRWFPNGASMIGYASKGAT